MGWVISPFWRRVVVGVVISFTFWVFIGWGLIVVLVVRLWARGWVVRRITFTLVLWEIKIFYYFLYKRNCVEKID